MQIIKSNSKRASIKTVERIPVENTAQALMEAVLKDYQHYQLSKILPYKDDAADLTKDSVDFSGVVQPIVFEFDHDSIEHQKQRVKVLAGGLKTPMWVVFSGNKSLHIYVWLKKFSNTPEEYADECMNLYWWACGKFPDYFFYTTETKLKNNPDVPQDQICNAPDKAMFQSSRYARQAGGIRSDEQ